MEKEFFVLLFLDWSVQIAGRTTQESIDKYEAGKGKLKIKEPLIFNHFPVEDKMKKGKTIVQTGIREIYPLPTDQNEMLFDANGLEVVSELANTDGVEYLVNASTPVKDMFTEYQKVITARRMKNSNIIPPTADNVSDITKYKVKL